MLVRSVVLRLPRPEPMAWNAEFAGAKIVTSLRLSTVSTRLALVRAPAKDVNPAAMAVSEGLSGKVRTFPIMWITPFSQLVHALSAVTINTGLPPVKLTS
jgi:hypothetical protein